MPSSRSAPNRRWAVPGTPIIPVPSRLMSATRSMLVMPLTGSADVGRAQIRVPTPAGANVLRIQMGMPSLTAGAMVCGCSTLAPKYASSIASLYESESMTVASGTRRGSADSTPSTSVQMWISDAPSSAPKMEAEKSLPFRPRVVCTPRRSEAMNPVMIRVPLKSAGTRAARLARDSAHWMPGPNGPHSATTTRRASSHCTAPGRRARSSKKRSNSRVDQISP